MGVRYRDQALPLMRAKSEPAEGVQLHHRLYASSPRPSSPGGRLKSWPGRVGTRMEVVIRTRIIPIRTAYHHTNDDTG